MLKIVLLFAVLAFAMTGDIQDSYTFQQFYNATLKSQVACGWDVNQAAQTFYFHFSFPYNAALAPISYETYLYPKDNWRTVTVDNIQAFNPAWRVFNGAGENNTIDAVQTIPMSSMDTATYGCNYTAAVESGSGINYQKHQDMYCYGFIGFALTSQFTAASLTNPLTQYEQRETLFKDNSLVMFTYTLKVIYDLVVKEQIKLYVITKISQICDVCEVNVAFTVVGEQCSNGDSTATCSKRFGPDGVTESFQYEFSEVAYYLFTITPQTRTFVKYNVVAGSGNAVIRSSTSNEDITSLVTCGSGATGAAYALGWLKCTFPVAGPSTRVETPTSITAGTPFQLFFTFALDAKRRGLEFLNDRSLQNKIEVVKAETPEMTSTKPQQQVATQSTPSAQKAAPVQQVYLPADNSKVETTLMALTVLVGLFLVSFLGITIVKAFKSKNSYSDVPRSSAQELKI